TFAQAGRALLARHAQSIELFVRIPLSDAEIEAAVRENIHARRVLGNPHGMLKRKQQDEGTDTNATGARRNGCSGWQERRVVAILGEMVLSQPHIVVAEFLGPHDLIEKRAVQLSIRPPPR